MQTSNLLFSLHHDHDLPSLLSSRAKPRSRGARSGLQAGDLESARFLDSLRSLGMTTGVVIIYILTKMRQNPELCFGFLLESAKIRDKYDQVFAEKHTKQPAGERQAICD